MNKHSHMHSQLRTHTHSQGSVFKAENTNKKGEYCAIKVMGWHNAKKHTSKLLLKFVSRRMHVMDIVVWYVHYQVTSEEKYLEFAKNEVRMHTGAHFHSDHTHIFTNIRARTHVHSYTYLHSFTRIHTLMHSYTQSHTYSYLPNRVFCAGQSKCPLGGVPASGRVPGSV
jgi:hypothetical protein